MGLFTISDRTSNNQHHRIYCWQAIAAVGLFCALATSGLGSSRANRSSRKATAKISIDQTRRFQTMEGFGSEPAQWFGGRACPQIDTVPDSAKKRILALLYGDLGLTGARTFVEFHGPGGDFDKFQSLAPVLAEAEKRARTTGDPFHIDIGGFVSWSFRRSNGRLLPDGAMRYAKWATNGLVHLARNGTLVQYWDIGPEPDGMGNLTPRELKQLILTTGAAFRAAGLTTQIAAPLTYTIADAPEYAIPLLRDPETRQYIRQLDFHEYDYDASRDQSPDIHDRHTIRKLASRYGLTVAMRETSTDLKRNRTTFWNGTYDQAMAWANDVMTDVLEANASAWDLIFADYIRNNPKFGVGSYLVLNFRNCKYAGFEIPPHYWTLRQFVKFVRPGAVRVSAHSNKRDLRVAAFIDSGRQETILVAINNSRKDDRYVEIIGAPSGSATATLTTATQHGVQVPMAKTQNNQFMVTLPPRSVVTFVFTP